jgi:hypothetical protein
MDREVHGSLEIGVPGDTDEEVVDRFGADRREHVGPLVIGMGKVAHQAVNSA